MMCALLPVNAQLLQ